jgi:hypothetical protein
MEIAWRFIFGNDTGKSETGWIAYSRMLPTDYFAEAREADQCTPTLGPGLHGINTGGKPAR